MNRRRKSRSAQLTRQRRKLKGCALLVSLGVPGWLKNYFDAYDVARVLDIAYGRRK